MKKILLLSVCIALFSYSCKNVKPASKKMQSEHAELLKEAQTSWNEFKKIDTLINSDYARIFKELSYLGYIDDTRLARLNDSVKALYQYTNYDHANIPADFSVIENNDKIVFKYFDNFNKIISPDKANQLIKDLQAEIAQFSSADVYSKYNSRYNEAAKNYTQFVTKNKESLEKAGIKTDKFMPIEGSAE